MGWRSLGFSLLLVATLAGCSSSDPPGELRTFAQADRFIAAVVRGEPAAHWHLSRSANADASRAWGERAAIADFGARVRALHRAAWACELAEGAAQMGFVKFTAGDRVAVTFVARSKGAEPAQIEPLIADVVRISNPDFKILSGAVCS